MQWDSEGSLAPLGVKKPLLHLRRVHLLGIYTCIYIYICLSLYTYIYIYICMEGLMFRARTYWGLVRSREYVVQGFKLGSFSLIPY